jgi:hypothetical protein
MSKPTSSNKLEGPAIYAPRRERERTVSSDRPAMEADAGGSDGKKAERGQQQVAKQAAAAKEAERRDRATQPKALDGVEEAIRTLIGLTHAPGKIAVASPRSHVPQDPSTASTRVQVNERPPQRSGTQGLDHDAARSAASRRYVPKPEIVPEPPAEVRRSGLLRAVMPISLATVFAVTTALITISTSQPGGLKSAIDRIVGTRSEPKEPRAIAEPLSRLVVEDQQTFVNEPLPLAVRVEHSAENELLLLDGFAPGTTLSAGTARSPSSWQLPYEKLDGLYLYAPKDFIGVMNTAVNLLGSDKHLLDSRTMQLKWIARQPVPVPKMASPEATVGTQLDAGHASVPAPKAASPEATASIQLDAGHASVPAPKPASPEATASIQLDAGHASVPAPKAASPEATASIQLDARHPPMPPIEPSEAAMLLRKGRDLLDSGDISAARVAFRRLADAGNAEAAMALASTYNPDYLAAHHFVGMRGDRATARALYRRAKELGSADADRFLMQMQRMR